MRMCPAHVAKSHFTDIAVSGRFPYSYAYRATQTAMKKPPRHARIAQLVEHQYKKCVTFPSPSCANSYVKRELIVVGSSPTPCNRLLSVVTKKRRCNRLMLNMGLLVCCSLPYVIISTPIIYSTVKTWFAASHNSAGSRTDRYNCLPYYTAGFE